MTSSTDTPESSSVAPNPYSDELIPGLPHDLVVAHVLDKFPDPSDLAPLSAVSRGMRAAVAETKREVKKPSGYEEAAKKGYLRYLKHMHSRNRLSDTRLLCAAAAASGQLEELKALRAENFPWGKGTCALAACMLGVCAGAVRAEKIRASAFATIVDEWRSRRARARRR